MRNKTEKFWQEQQASVIFSEITNCIKYVFVNIEIKKFIQYNSDNTLNLNYWKLEGSERMPDTYLKKRFFEKSLFIIADEYCRLNITKDLIPGVVHKVVDGKVYDINEQLGMPENAKISEIIPLWAASVPEEERGMFLEFWDRDNLLKRFENGEEHIYIHYWSKTPGHEAMRAEDHVAMFRDAETGDVLGVNYVLDRTEHYRLEKYKEELEKKNRQLDEMIKKERGYKEQLAAAYENAKRQLDIFSESIKGGIKISRSDENQTLKFVSNQYASMLGYESSEELLAANGGDFIDMIHPDDIEQSMKDAMEQYSKENSYSLTFRMKCKDGSWKYVEDHGRKLVNKDGETEYWNLVIDKHELVTKNIALESERQTNEAKNDFLSRISHDIRTPLNGIIGLLDNGDRHSDDVKLLASDRKKARVAADHLLALMNDILDLNEFNSDRTELPHETVDLNKLLENVKIISKMRADSKHIDFYIDDKFSLKYPYVWGSELHIKQILLNVITNAVKYNDPPGSVYVTVDQKELGDNRVELFIQVKDDGIGMSKEFLSHIFEPFSQERKDARSVYLGTGLGMSIVKSLVENMNGAVSVASELGKGTSVYISIPFDKAEEKSDEFQEDCYMKGSLEGIKVLLAEDNELNMEIAKYMLEGENIIITEAINGAEAVDKFREAPAGTFDVIIMDVMMPVMDGLTAASTIRGLENEDAKSIPIIAMTANAFKRDVQRCLEAGMNAHVSKPVYADKLFSAIARLVRR